MCTPSPLKVREGPLMGFASLNPSYGPDASIGIRP